jgi:uncharacterized membrane protein
MQGLCKYKDILGKPREGIRKYRIFDISIMDTVVVLIFGYIISWYMQWNLWIVLIVLFISGIIVHKIFCVRTRIDRWIFPN